MRRPGPSTSGLTGNLLPAGHRTGSFLIADDDPAAECDQNRSAITENEYEIRLPANPAVNATEECVSGEVGFLLSGVVLHSPVDALGRDAVAHELQDHRQDHPTTPGTTTGWWRARRVRHRRHAGERCGRLRRRPRRVPRPQHSHHPGWRGGVDAPLPRHLRSRQRRLLPRHSRRDERTTPGPDRLGSVAARRHAARSSSVSSPPSGARRAGLLLSSEDDPVVARLRRLAHRAGVGADRRAASSETSCRHRPPVGGPSVMSDAQGAAIAAA